LNSDIWTETLTINALNVGTIYDNTAGIPASVQMQTRDYFQNKLITGGRSLELAILGVGGMILVFP
jgi:hypothetical protein